MNIDNSDVSYKTDETKETDKHEFNSATYIPYYDRIPKYLNDEALEEDEFEFINEEDAYENPDNDSNLRPKTEIIKNEDRKSSFEIKPIILPKSENMLRFMPTCADISSIMSDTQIMMIARVLPPLFRMREWKKVFSIETDGVSLHTFYKKAKDQSNSIMFIQDHKNYKFG